MSEFFSKVADFLLTQWPWLIVGAALVALLWFATRVARSAPSVSLLPAALQERLNAPIAWYSGNRSARRLTVNVLGAALVLWFAKTFALWVQPALTPDLLFTLPVVGPQGVDVVFVQERSLEDRVVYTGSVQPLEDAVIYTRVDGWIEALHVYPGDVVKRSQVLATIETSSLLPRLQHAKADTVFWQAEHDRDQQLFAAGAIGESELERTAQQHETALARLHMIETEIDYATVRAPLDGIVSERNVYSGVYVKRGAALLKVDQLNEVRIQFSVAEKDLLWIQPGMRVYLSFPQADSILIRSAFKELLVDHGDSTEERPPELRTMVTSVFPAEDPVTHTGTVEVRLPNPQGVLKTHTYAVADIVRRQVDTAVVIPTAALTPSPDGSDVVFVGPAFADEGPAERREVMIGLTTDQGIEVLAGVDAGEFVIIRGNRTLTNGQTVRVVDREGGF